MEGVTSVDNNNSHQGGPFGETVYVSYATLRNTLLSWKLLKP